ncbi:DNA-3-methyladenine glycosylase II KNAG_0G01570 [Huiozyma naganishii CBS 8797]|uniref:HhH-GPD domain-containing protein n=1 Tax=Huiozyma naganishii (strain ATCC MYA-139 / BCRC 22969 / CBS 8797 / KCTC 17520 / NBRC 10181 / NCYC 3082 / Yp74L-3) TaxID=1071383 RepID=J7R8L8_HUIN7|nr:hypothetical protein KNAG_0G01570 [Kazachstania naganishii CBS 8797]CCK71215.1 hypothetical protein KNAG_0G01570 [Kazachstania naganishii CBS 8797]
MITRAQKRSRAETEKQDDDNEHKQRLKEDEIVLPSDFIEKHTNEFVIGCERVLEVDPSVRTIMLLNSFMLFYRTDDSDDIAKVSLQDAFTRLGSTIMGQQISNNAAMSIRKRFMDHFDGLFPTFLTLHKDLKDPEKRSIIKACGLSDRKLSYLESLALYFSENSKEIDTLFKTRDNDSEVVDHLVNNIKGIGPWSAKMFLLTALKRLNVFVPEDLGIARGFSRYISDKPELLAELMKNRGSVIKKSKIKHKKFNWTIYDDDIMEACADRFAPYRSIFMVLMWRLSSEDTMAMVKIEKEFMQQI